MQVHTAKLVGATNHFDFIGPVWDTEESRAAIVNGHVDPSTGRPRLLPAMPASLSGLSSAVPDISLADATENLARVRAGGQSRWTASALVGWRADV